MNADQERWRALSAAQAEAVAAELEDVANGLCCGGILDGRIAEIEDARRDLPAKPEEVRVVLVKPGDVLLIGNLGERSQAEIHSMRVAAGQLRDQIGVDVALFRGDIDIAAYPPPAEQRCGIRLPVEGGLGYRECALQPHWPEGKHIDASGRSFTDAQVDRAWSERNSTAEECDPTHGQIDSDIQQQVEEMNPTSLGQRVAMERTLQDRRGAARGNSTAEECGHLDPDGRGFRCIRPPGHYQTGSRHGYAGVFWDENP